MSISVGTRLGPYEVVSALSGRRACGYAEPRPSDAEARHQRQQRWGWGPSASEKAPAAMPSGGL